MSESICSDDVVIAEWLNLIRAEYLEMPGLHLTRLQAQRLWCLDSTTSEVLLETLAAAGFLRRARGGGYVLADRSRGVYPRA